MIGTTRPRLRFTGSGDTLRLRVATAPDPLANIRQCCRASVAVEKALAEEIRDAGLAGHSWDEIGRALGVEAQTRSGVRDQYATSRSWMRSRFWGSDEGSTR